MNEEQARDLMILIVLCLVFLGPFVYWLVSLSKKYKKQGVNKLVEFIDSLEGDPFSYKIYTTGHPYAWSEISLAEAKK